MKSELQYCYKFVTSKSDYTFVPAICQQIPQNFSTIPPEIFDISFMLSQQHPYPDPLLYAIFPQNVHVPVIVIASHIKRLLP